MHPISERNLALAGIPWTLSIIIAIFWAGGLVNTHRAESALPQYFRLIIFLTIVVFWYWFSLYVRQRIDGQWVPFLSKYRGWLWDIIVTFQIFLLPTTFLSIYGIIFALTGIFIFEWALIINTILWMFFFLVESAGSQGDFFSNFNFSQLNWFTVVGIVLDIVGIVFSVIDIMK